MYKKNENSHCLLFIELYILIILFAGIIFPSFAIAEDRSYKIHPDYERLMPKVITVLPMDNLSLEPDIETFLYNEVYGRLKSKGYIRIAKETVLKKMGKLGVQTPGQIAEFTPQALGKMLKCDAIFRGGIEQSAAQHGGVYDAIVVSCSLYLISCSDGQVLWSYEQKRTAHRQWQLDPLNALINFVAHEKGSRKDRVAWLVQEMLKTLPQGAVRLVDDDFLKRAVEIQATPIP